MVGERGSAWGGGGTGRAHSRVGCGSVRRSGGPDHQKRRGASGAVIGNPPAALPRRGPARGCRTLVNARHEGGGAHEQAPQDGREGGGGGVLARRGRGCQRRSRCGPRRAGDGGTRPRRVAGWRRRWGAGRSPVRDPPEQPCAASWSADDGCGFNRVGLLKCMVLSATPPISPFARGWSVPPSGAMARAAQGC